MHLWPFWNRELCQDSSGTSNSWAKKLNPLSVVEHWTCCTFTSHLKLIYSTSHLKYVSKMWCLKCSFWSFQVLGILSSSYSPHVFKTKQTQANNLSMFFFPRSWPMFSVTSVKPPTCLNFLALRWSLECFAKDSAQFPLHIVSWTLSFLLKLITLSLMSKNVFNMKQQSTEVWQTIF